MLKMDNIHYLRAKNSKGQTLGYIEGFMKNYFFSSNKVRQYYLAFGDILFLSLSLIISFWLRLHLFEQKPETLIAFLNHVNHWMFLILPVNFFFIYLFNFYNINDSLAQHRVNSFYYFVKSSVILIVAFLLAGCCFAAVLFFFPKYVIGRHILIIHILCSVVILILWRFVYFRYFCFRFKERRVVIVGPSVLVLEFLSEVKKWPNTGLNIVQGIVTDNPLNTSWQKRFHEVLQANNFDVLAFDAAMTQFDDSAVQKILELKAINKAIYDLATFYKNLFGKVPVAFINGRWLLQDAYLLGERKKFYFKTKRLLDLLFASVLLIVFFPLIIGIVLLIKLSSKGPVLFTIERIGYLGKSFRCMKFRSMAYEKESAKDPQLTQKNDGRITSVGKILRKLRLDELPQLINIIRGEMSFVGPRPIRRHFAELFAKDIPFYWLRFNVRPGLSGWAQVKQDYTTTVVGHREKFEYEMFYLEHKSFLLDVFIVLKTMQNVFFGKGQ
jgi:exopolysaccharide biosynthesis polyprenyl glycosylphosphotransferase